MENTIADIVRLEKEFRSCQRVLTAIGDETRMHILFIMLNRSCSGQRVVDIAAKTNLSRPAVSHHMQILKDAALVKDRKEGAYIYYYLEPQPDQVEKRICLFQDIQKNYEQCAGSQRRNVMNAYR